MPRLVSADLFIGRAIRLDGIRHRIARMDRGGLDLVLVRDGSEASTKMARAELYAQIVEERAELEDEAEDPDLTHRMHEVNLSQLSIDRQIDWYHKLILLRQLQAHVGRSFRSKKFKAESSRARELLKWVKDFSGVSSEKTWSDKRLYDDLRRWRRAGYSLAALQVKGLQYRPWTNRREKYVRAGTIIQKIREQNPYWSAAAVHKMAKHLMRKSAHPEPSKEGCHD